MNAPIVAIPSTVEDLQVMTVETAADPAPLLLLTAMSPGPVEEMIGTVMTDAAYNHHLPTLIDTFLAKIPALAARV
jgi:hypothetical protein